MVARLGQATVLIQLPRADLAAATAVQHEADARRALGKLRWALDGAGGGGGGEDLCSQQ